MSLSLALGILVGDLNNISLLTSAHAQADTCGGGGTGSTVIGSTVFINNGVATGGIAVRDVIVNGQLVPEGVIAGSVQIIGGDVLNANGVIVGGYGEEGAPDASGVIVGGAPCINGVIVGGYGEEGAPGRSGVIVGGYGEGDVTLGGASVNTSGTAIGGTLTGDDITVNGGVITGLNLRLTGALIDGGSITGVTATVNVPPSN